MTASPIRLGGAVSLIAVLLAGTPGLAVATTAPAVPDGGSPLTEVVDGWANGSVYVDPTQDALVTDADAAHLAQRLDGHSPATFIAVLPASGLSGQPGGTDHERADAFLDDLVDAQAADGVYVVVFGGKGSWGTAVGYDVPVGPVVEDALAEHTRSEVVPMLDTVLDGLDVPGDTAAESRPSERPAWAVPAIIGVVVLLAAAGALLWWRGRRDGRSRGPALYRPSFETLPDEADTLDERRRLAREDVTRFGEEISAADPDVSDPVVAGHVQAAMTSYDEMSRAVDGDPDDAVLRAVRQNVEYGRWRLAAALATLAGRPVPARRAACFFDQKHGISATDWMYSPAGGTPREVPVCEPCRARLEESRR